MKLKPETLAYLKQLSPDERKEFLNYLRDADENVKTEVNYIDRIDDEAEYVHDVEPNEPE